VRFHRFDVVPPGGRIWISQWVEPGFPVAELVASWNATLPRGCVLKLEVQLRLDTAESEWFALGRWAHGPDEVARTSVPGQRDAHADVIVDRLVVSADQAGAYRVRSTVDCAEGPVRVGLLGVMAADRAGAGGGVPTSVPLGMAMGLDVPALSQQVHRGRYPELGGGGAAWCAPTSTAMMLGYWGVGPSEAEMSALGASYPDPIVAHTALHVYDHAYGGTGNWSFNAAHAGSFGLEAFVTRLGSLREAELFLAAGVPLVLSIAVGPDELSGFPVSEGTDGHLLVLTGVTGAGDAVVNDPAAPVNDDVRRTYRRDELERAWLDGSGGVVLVLHPHDIPLPPGSGRW
jgi:hypothetical protein